MDRLRRNKLEWDKQEAAKLQQKRDTAARAFWSRQVKDFGQTKMDDPGAFDEIGLPERTIELSKQQFLALCNECDAKIGKRGFELTHAGGVKMQCYMMVQHANGRSLAGDTIEKCFNRLQSLGCFNQHEIIFDENKIVVSEEQKPEPTFDELLETTSTDTREGAAKLRAAAEEHFLTHEARSMFTAWEAQLYRDYKFIPKREDLIEIIDMFQRRNLSFLRHDNYNAARRWMVHRSKWPNTMLTEDERVADEIERTDLSRQDYSSRKQLGNKIQAQYPQAE